jgi:hypothetical protein
MARAKPKSTKIRAASKRSHLPTPSKPPPTARPALRMGIHQAPKGSVVFMSQSGEEIRGDIHSVDTVEVTPSGLVWWVNVYCHATHPGLASPTARVRVRPDPRYSDRWWWAFDGFAPNA